MGSRSQRKGRAGEIELAELLREHGIPAAVGRPMNFGNCPDVDGVLGVHVECKRVERLNIDTAMDQAVRDSERFGDGMPTLFHRRNRKPWLVTIRLDDWLKLYRGFIKGEVET